MSEKNPKIFDRIPTAAAVEAADPSSLLFGELEHSAEIIGAFTEAVRTENTMAIATFLKNYQLLEYLVLTKGKNGEYLHLIQAALTVMERWIGSGFAKLTQSRQSEELIRNGGVDPMAVAESISTLYHLKRDQSAIVLAQAVVALPEDVLPVLPRAHIYNSMAATLHRQGLVTEALEHNRQGMRALQNDPQFQQDPNLRWQHFKIFHGLLVQRAEHAITADMPDQLVTLAQRRRQLGDDMHIGRTFLDIGRLTLRLGDTERGLHYLSLAVDDLTDHGYINAAVQAANELAQAHKRLGLEARARTVLVKGIGLGERLGILLRAELEMMKHELEKTMVMPATCLIKLGDYYLLERIGKTADEVRYLGITVDQERQKNGEATVRKKLAAFINHLYYLVDPVAAVRQPIVLSQRNTGVYFQGKEKREIESVSLPISAESLPQTTKLFFRYTVELPHSEACNILQQALDKVAYDGYTVLTWEKLFENRERCDTETQRLIEAIKRQRVSK